MDAPKPAHERDETDWTDAGDGVRDPDRVVRWEAWRAENAGAIAAYNLWFDEGGHKYLRGPLF